MARYTGPKCKLCRREGTKLFLKGTRCFSEKCAVGRRNQPPGQHGKGRKRDSDYARHLREKQKVKRIYGILETQFRRYFENASKVRGVTGQVLLQLLESRLDSVIYSAGILSSRQSARQIVRERKVTVNGKKIDIPSYQVKAGDFVKVEGYTVRQKEEDSLPSWVEWDTNEGGVKVTRLPEREDVSAEINEQLIVEFYSR